MSRSQAHGQHGVRLADSTETGLWAHINPQSALRQPFRGVLALAIFFKVEFVPRSMNTSSFFVG